MIEALQDKPEPVVKIDNLCMEFGETVALDGVSFEIQRGEIFVAYGILMGMTMIISIMGIFFSSVFDSTMLISQKGLSRSSDFEKSLRSCTFQPRNLFPKSARL